MADFSSVFFSTITEINAKLVAKEFSAVELTRAFCDRLDRVAPRYNALALSLREQAVKQARDVDDELRRDRTRGPLQGIPYGAKDLLAVKGKPTTWGARPLAGQVFDEDAQVIQKLNKTGAILTGKLAMVELAGGGDYRLASASLTGAGLNPWDRTRWSGGSSSGSAAAVAAGLVTFALGSETSGSIITPAAFCGVTGLRPTYGLVSRRGAMALSWTLDKIGPICHSAEDCALVLHVISGSDVEDPGSAGRSFSYNPKFVRKPSDLTIGYAPVDFNEWADPSMRPGLQEALRVVKAMGFRTKEIELPDFPYGAVVGMIIAGEAGSIFEEFIRSGKVRPTRRSQPDRRAEGIAGRARGGLSPRHARADSGARSVSHSVSGCGHAARARPIRHRPERVRAAGHAPNRTEAVVARIERLDSRGQSCGLTRPLASLRFRGRLADCDFAGGTAVLRESTPHGRERLPEPDRLAPA